MPVQGPSNTKDIVADMRQRLHDLEDVKTTDAKGKKIVISIEHLLVLLLVQKSQHVSTFLGNQASDLNSLNTKSTEATKLLNGGYSGWIDAVKGLKTCMDKFKTPLQDTMLERFPISDATVHKLDPFLPPSEQLKPVVGGIDTAPYQKNGQTMYYYSGHRISVAMNALDQKKDSLQSILTDAGVSTDILDPSFSPSTYSTQIKNVISNLNQEGQTKMQGMTKTMHYATQYQQMAAQFINSFNQEIKTSINDLKFF